MKKYLLAALAFLPVSTFATASSVDTSGLQGTVRGLINVVNLLIPFFLAIAIIAFIIGVIRFILANGAENKDRARNMIIWGVIGIFAIVAVFGIARLLTNLFGLDPRQLQNNEVPTVGTNPVPGL